MLAGADSTSVSDGWRRFEQYLDSSNLSGAPLLARTASRSEDDDEDLTMMHIDFRESIFEVVLKKSTPTQIYDRILYLY